MATVAQILQQAKTLSAEERKELVKLIIDTLDTSQKRSLKELRGLGKDIWQGIDALEYVARLRREWDDRP
jgi:hypothetical protein